MLYCGHTVKGVRSAPATVNEENNHMTYLLDDIHLGDTIAFEPLGDSHRITGTVKQFGPTLAEGKPGVEYEDTTGTLHTAPLTHVVSLMRADGTAVPARVLTGGLWHRPLWAIAKDITAAWGGPGKVYYGAKRCLDALSALEKPADTYGVEQADDLLLRLTVNWSTLRGEQARGLKAEVKTILRAAGHRHIR